MTEAEPMKAGYKVLLPVAVLDDHAQLDDYTRKVIEDMARLADGFDPEIHEPVPKTAVVKWQAVELPRLDDDGAVLSVGQAQHWQRGDPLPEWAQAALLHVTVEMRTPGPVCPR